MERDDPQPVDGPVDVDVDVDVVGIDLGLNCFALLSEGTQIQSPRPLAKALRRLRHRQRLHSRKQCGPRNRRKSAAGLARRHRHIRCQRTDFLHKAATARTMRGARVGRFASCLLAARRPVLRGHLRLPTNLWPMWSVHRHRILSDGAQPTESGTSWSPDPPQALPTHPLHLVARRHAAAAWRGGDPWTCRCAGGGVTVPAPQASAGLPGAGTAPSLTIGLAVAARAPVRERSGAHLAECGRDCPLPPAIAGHDRASAARRHAGNIRWRIMVPTHEGWRGKPTWYRRERCHDGTTACAKASVPYGCYGRGYSTGQVRRRPDLIQDGDARQGRHRFYTVKEVRRVPGIRPEV